jgi:hypothetical protein
MAIPDRERLKIGNDGRGRARDQLAGTRVFNFDAAWRIIQNTRTASALVPAFGNLAEHFDENEGILVELQD